ncbi:MAG: UvrD-helicase domain-containing protein, partial [Gammaproteobacteria bacterium]
MTEQLLADAAQRDGALDVHHSYAVQAPAGSGKTELLTLRFLKLLAMVDEPEAVLAITFTRKAASEMSNRILNALQWAAAQDGSQRFDNSHTQARFEAAAAVLARDQAMSWQLLQNPARLRIQTIDSFCAYLAGRLPLLSSLGGGAQVEEDNSEIYLEAVRNTLEQLKGEGRLVDELASLLLHLDNDLG